MLGYWMHPIQWTPWMPRDIMSGVWPPPWLSVQPQMKQQKPVFAAHLFSSVHSCGAMERWLDQVSGVLSSCPALLIISIIPTMAYWGSILPSWSEGYVLHIFSHPFWHIILGLSESEVLLRPKSSIRDNFAPTSVTLGMCSLDPYPLCSWHFDFSSFSCPPQLSPTTISLLCASLRQFYGFQSPWTGSHAPAFSSSPSSRISLCLTPFLSMQSPAPLHVALLLFPLKS